MKLIEYHITHPNCHKKFYMDIRVQRKKFDVYIPGMSKITLKPIPELWDQLKTIYFIGRN